MKTVITFGTYDLLHIGHINILNRSGEYGDKLVVGVSSDALNYKKKKKYPIYTESDRMNIINNIKIVDEVFLEESLELKKDYILKYNADILIMGDDWEGKFDHLNNICQVIYLPRTKEISTTETIDTIVNEFGPMGK
jgi:glycerol-3-phosphate cytidylyltransferase